MKLWTQPSVFRGDGQRVDRLILRFGVQRQLEPLSEQRSIGGIVDENAFVSAAKY
jgi:hypothetical protein